MSAVRNDNKAVTFLIVACSIGFSAGHCDAGVIATFEEINGGNDLRVSVSGFLNTAALGSSSSTTLNANLARGQGSWAYLAMSSSEAVDRWTIGVTTSGVGSSFASLLISGGGVLVSGPEFFFAANDFDNDVYVQNSYVSGTGVNSVVEYAGKNFASQGISPGDELTKQWAGGGAGHFITFTTAVPEPATFTLLGLGSLGFGVVAYRRRKKQAA